MTKQREQRPTATIYAFPGKPRATSGSHKQAQPVPQQTVFPTFACNSSWYHQAAIEEADDADDLPHLQH
jgi:hypothetical protein